MDAPLPKNVVEALGDLLVSDFRRLFNAGEASPTDRATLLRLLTANGWSIDPGKLPADLRQHVAGSLPVDAGLDDPDEV